MCEASLLGDHHCDKGVKVPPATWASYRGTSVSPECLASEPAPCWLTPGKAAKDGLCTWSPVTCMGDHDEVMGSWLQPASKIAAILANKINKAYLKKKEEKEQEEKTVLRTHASHIGLPRIKTQLCSSCHLPSNAHHRRQWCWFKQLTDLPHIQKN